MRSCLLQGEIKLPWPSHIQIGNHQIGHGYLPSSAEHYRCYQRPREFEAVPESCVLLRPKPGGESEGSE